MPALIFNTALRYSAVEVSFHVKAGEVILRQSHQSYIADHPADLKRRDFLGFVGDTHHQ